MDMIKKWRKSSRWRGVDWATTSTQNPHTNKAKTITKFIIECMTLHSKYTSFVCCKREYPCMLRHHEIIHWNVQFQTDSNFLHYSCRWPVALIKWTIIQFSPIRRRPKEKSQKKPKYLQTPNACMKINTMRKKFAFDYFECSRTTC